MSASERRQTARRIIVTGCASGIGAALVNRLVAQGHLVFGLDRITPADGLGLAAFLPLDLADPAAIRRATDQLRGQPAPFDALCNVAGLPPRPEPAAVANVLQVNFLGTRDFTLQLLPELARDAAIVSVASRAGLRWREHLPQVQALLACRTATDLAQFIDRQQLRDSTRAYDLSKEALIAWSQAMAAPLAALGLRANTVSPGAVETPILSDFMTAFGARARGQIARLGRVGQPDEIAAAIAFLASPASGWIRGIDLGADGGAAARAENDALQLSQWGVITPDLLDPMPQTEMPR